MARLNGSCLVAPVSLSAATALTIFQMNAPTNQRCVVYSFRLSFDGTNSANTPATIRIMRQTGGTFTNTTVAPKKVNDPSGTGETLQLNYKTVTTVEPTYADVLEEFTEPVFGGLLSQSYAPNQEIHLYGGSNLGFVVTAAQTVNCGLTVLYEE